MSFSQSQTKTQEKVGLPSAMEEKGKTPEVTLDLITAPVKRQKRGGNEGNSKQRRDWELIVVSSQLSTAQQHTILPSNAEKSKSNQCTRFKSRLSRFPPGSDMESHVQKRTLSRDFLMPKLHQNPGFRSELQNAWNLLQLECKGWVTTYTFLQDLGLGAEYSGAQVRVLSAPPHFHFGQTNSTPEFLCKFPAGKVPAFEGDDGFCVFESNAIAYYVSNEELRGSTPEAAAQVVQWVSFAESDIVPPASTWVFPTLGIMHHNKQATENAKEEVRRILGLLDAHLETRTFLVGERVTLADITVVCTLLWLYKQVLEPSFRQAFPNTNRWFLTCINQPQFRAVLGEVKLCKKMAQFDAKKFAESQPKKDIPRKEKGSREEKQKPQGGDEGSCPCS
ncbi:hypothetical protein MC885_002749 [Smutsia gigantea]|nr:hypothetical protein MC885_002749 [Smutsia gigantea]